MKWKSTVVANGPLFEMRNVSQFVPRTRDRSWPAASSLSASSGVGSGAPKTASWFGRVASDGYHGASDALGLAEIKAAFRGPLIGNGGYDAPDRRWEALMEEMAAAKFMKDGLIVLEDLAAAVNSRLPKPFDMEALEEELEIAEGESLTANDAANSYVIGEALDHLGFRQKGL